MIGRKASWTHDEATELALSRCTTGAGRVGGVYAENAGAAKTPVNPLHSQGAGALSSAGETVNQSPIAPTAVNRHLIPLVDGLNIQYTT